MTKANPYDEEIELDQELKKLVEEEEVIDVIDKKKGDQIIGTADYEKDTFSIVSII